MAKGESAMPGDEVERWLPIANWEGFYEVSDKGRVRRLERVETARNGRKLRLTAQIVHPWNKGSGYPAVTLRAGGRTANPAVHTLIRQAFGIAPAMQPAPDAGEPERWLPVAEYGNLYEVSDLGRVRTRRRKGSKGGLLRPGLSADHLTVALYMDGVPRSRLVHHLVLEAFVGPRPPGMEGCHGPGGSLVNRLDNLRWDSPSANQMDRVRDGTSNRGERQGQAVLTAEIVTSCRQRYAAGERLHVLVAEYGVTVAGMSNAVSGKTWSWLPGAIPVDRHRNGVKGAEHHGSKLTTEIVLECRRRYAAGENSYALAREFGVAQPTMHKAIVGGTWKHI